MPRPGCLYCLPVPRQAVHSATFAVPHQNAPNPPHSRHVLDDVVTVTTSRLIFS
jgi:hypothetical protein